MGKALEGLVITWRELLLLVIAVLAVYVAEMLVFLRGSGRRRWAQRAADGSGEALAAVSQDIAQLRDQVLCLERELASLREEDPAPERDSPYNQAIVMARRGLSATEVASGCGISRGEAELIIALYRRPGVGR